MTPLSLESKNTLVTGGAGFIGSHLVDALLDAGAARVVAVDNLFLGRPENLASARATGGDRFAFHEQDATDAAGMADILRRHEIHVVFDLAVVPLPTSLERPKWSVDQNTLMATTICELGREGLYQTLVAFSSSEALGSARAVPMAEDHPLEPTTPYAASKAASDLIVCSYGRTFGLDATVLRPFNNFGPRQNDKAYAGIIPVVVRRVEAGEPIEVFGDGEQTRDFIFAPDTARAAIDMYRHPETRGRVLHIGTGRETSVNTLVATMLEAMGREGHPVVHGPPRPGDVRRHCADTTLARRLIDFQPRVDLRRGIRQTIEWYHSRPDT